MYAGKPHNLFIHYAVPQMVGLLFNSIYTIVDGVFIGNRLGRDAMAAAAVAVPLVEVLISLGLAVGSGAAVLIAVQMEERRPEEARRVFGNAVWMLGLTGLLIAVLGNAFLQPLAEQLGAEPEILDSSMVYLRYIVSFAPFQLLSFLLGSMARNDSCPRLAMAAMIVGAVSNIVLDYVFMYPLGMGIGGAALATALGPLFSVLILLPHFLWRRGTLYFIMCQPALGYIAKILICGFPSFIMEFSIGMVTFLYNIAIIHYGYGEIGLAAYLMIGYLMLMILTLFLGMAEGLQPVFSHYMASGETVKNRIMLRFSATTFLIVGIASYILALLYSEHFYAVFTPDDIELASFAATKTPLYFSGFFLAGINILMVSFWQSTRSTGKALLLSLLRSLLLPPVLMLVLPVLSSREAVWACQSIAEALTACCAWFLNSSPLPST